MLNMTSLMHERKEEVLMMNLKNSRLEENAYKDFYER